MEGEGSESESVFESLNLNPGLLVNEVLNTVENLLDEAFDHYHQEASTLVNAEEGTDKSQQLTQESLDESLASQDVLCHPDLDAQLESLRDKLNLVGKERAEMTLELRALERQSTSSDSCVALVNEALQLYEQNFVDGMHQEMVKTASELRTKLEKRRTTRIEDADCSRIKRFFDPKRDLSTLNYGLSNAKLEALQEFAADLKKM